MTTLLAGGSAGAQTGQGGQGSKAEIQFSAPSYVAAERDGSVEITVARTGDTSSAVAVGYTTIKGTASDISDYIPSVGTLRFLPGETAKTFTILIIKDRRREAGETVRLVLSSPAGGAGLGAVSAASLTITDDAAAVSSANPIEDAQFFVRQHYLDFLNREPDAPGAAFWAEQITRCGQEPGCIEVSRVNVSAAFFLSIEFHDTGYLVYRLHQAAFNSGERLRLGDYLPDSQAIRANLVVGQGNWEQQLADNRRAYLNDFVARQAFLDKYPPSMTAAEFVDALNANAGGALSQTERDALVGKLAGGTVTRAEALLAVADDADFDRREVNRAFVLMQYFGYLRRNPNDPPDANFDGHAFWLRKLDQFGGDFVRAEMVKAFLVSGEYMSRFGPQTLAVTPDKTDPNQTVTVSINGQFTNFIKDVTRASFGPGVSVGGAPAGEFGPVNVISRTTATAQLTLSATAQGVRSVTVVSGAERVTLDNGFDVRDTIRPVIVVSPTNNSTVRTKQPTVEISYSDAGSGVDISTLVIVVDGTDMTRFFVVTETKATCHLPLSGGQHIIDVKLKDKAGNEGRSDSRFTVSVFEALPEAVPTSGVAPLVVTFITKAEYTDGGITGYRWDFQGDGTFDTDEPGARNFTRTYTQKGVFKPVLEVENDKGEKTTATLTITVSGAPPTASASVNPSNGAVPLAVNFTGTGTDPDGQIVKFEWDFEGDGTFDFSSPTTGSATHTYNTAGNFNALFRVTDNDGQTAAARVTTTAVRVGPPGSPRAQITNPAASSVAGNTPFNVNFNGAGTDPGGQIVKFEWDFQGDGTFDFSSPTSPVTSFRYDSPGLFTAALRVTDNDGLTGVDTVDIVVNTMVTLTLSTDTCKPLQGGTIDVNTTLGGTVPVTLFVRNKAGQTVRTLVNNVSRVAGTYKDTWDCKDAGGQPVAEGVYYALLQYQSGGQTRTLDLTNTTGNQFFNPSWTMSTTDGANCFSCPFRPFEDNFLKVDFTLNRASEATVSIRLFNRVDEVALIFDRRPYGRGTHTVFWDGTDAAGRLVAPPPGESFLWGMTAFTLPDNGVFVEAAPQITAVSADPNYFDPATGDFLSPQRPKAAISYTLSKQADVTLQVFRSGSNALLRTVTKPNSPAGAGAVEWDGRNDAGVFADKGDYRLALKATDAAGNQSLVRYVLMRVFY